MEIHSCDTCGRTEVHGRWVSVSDRLNGGRFLCPDCRQHECNLMKLKMRTPKYNDDVPSSRWDGTLGFNFDPKSEP